MEMNVEVAKGIPTCPYCGQAKPTLALLGQPRPVELSLVGASGYYQWWAMYRCTNCENVCLAGSKRTGSNAFGAMQPIQTFSPTIEIISDHIPERPKHYLTDAQNSLNAPTGSIVSSASAIDAMLKIKGVGRYSEDERTERSLSKRINIAVEQNILTKGMSEWAHRVRLDANAQRHSDEEHKLPTPEEARQTLRLAKAIAELLFVLPAEVAATTPQVDSSAPRETAA